ncbi:MAG: glycosyltransferase family 9 protein [Deltaproteobacteria bacterium]|nr:glycosyltransferase family 9 protein [Deltaproteobacteria bacterium]
MATPDPFSKKILVLFPGALGDFICFLPALDALARDGEVDLLARTEYADLAPPRIRTGSLERYEISRLFVAGAEREERLERFFGSYSSVYSWMGSGQRDFVGRLETLCGGRLGIFPFRPEDSRVPVVDYFLSCLGVERPRELPPYIPVRAEASAWSEEFWRRGGLRGKKVLVLTPGSGAREKNWPLEFFLEVVEWWKRKFTGESLIVLGPVEEELGRSGKNWQQMRVVGGLDLAKLAALIRRCDLYLGNDSGVTHLASALGVETVALFGPTDPLEWAPYGNRTTVISQNIECSPCSTQVMKNCPHRKCLTTLSAAHVIGRVEKFLAKTRENGTLLDNRGCRD